MILTWSCQIWRESYIGDYYQTFSAYKCTLVAAHVQLFACTCTFIRRHSFAVLYMYMHVSWASFLSFHIPCLSALFSLHNYISYITHILFTASSIFPVFCTSSIPLLSNIPILSSISPSSIYYSFLSNAALFCLLLLPLKCRPLLFITPSSPITHSSMHYPFVSPYPPLLYMDKLQCAYDIGV